MKPTGNEASLLHISSPRSEDSCVESRENTPAMTLLAGNSCGTPFLAPVWERVQKREFGMLKTQSPGDGRNPILGSKIRPGVETGGLDQGGRVDQGRAV